MSLKRRGADAALPRRGWGCEPRHRPAVGGIRRTANDRPVAVRVHPGLGDACGISSQAPERDIGVPAACRWEAYPGGGDGREPLGGTPGAVSRSTSCVDGSDGVGERRVGLDYIREDGDDAPCEPAGPALHQGAPARRAPREPEMTHAAAPSGEPTARRPRNIQLRPGRPRAGTSARAPVRSGAPARAWPAAGARARSRACSWPAGRMGRSGRA
jgi:hypothetical protein